MEVNLSPTLEAQLREYAERHGQDPAAALDEVLTDALEWERLDFHDAVEGIREGLEDMEAGRTQPAEEVFEELRVKYGLPR